MLGDSHAMGLGVEGAAAFPSVLEERLQRRTLNAGISSYGTAREMMLLRQLDRSNAKYIVLQYCSNDHKENLAYLAGGGELDTMSRAKYRQLVEAEARVEGSVFNPGLTVVRRGSNKLLGWAGLTESNPSRGDEAEALYQVLEKNRDLLEGKTLILLHLNGHNKMGAAVIEGAREKFQESGLDVLYVRADQLLSDDDYLNLDNHMRPAGHRKIGEAIAELVEAAERRK